MPGEDKKESKGGDATERSAAGPWLTISEAAAYLHVPTRMIRRLIDERRCRSYKAGRYVLFKQADLDRWASAEPREAVR